MKSPWFYWQFTVVWPTGLPSTLEITKSNFIILDKKFLAKIHWVLNMTNWNCCTTDVQTIDTNRRWDLIWLSAFGYSAMYRCLAWEFEIRILLHCHHTVIEKRAGDQVACISVGSTCRFTDGIVNTVKSWSRKKKIWNTILLAVRNI